MKNKDIYLSDKQYLNLLIRARKNLNTIERADGFDCTDIGAKDTQTNIGLCNEQLTTREIALFPGQNSTMKYLKENHKCPLDGRTEKQTNMGWSLGCFYGCLFFKKGLRNLKKIKMLYDVRIKEEGGMK